jgi:hypothetical protein
LRGEFFSVKKPLFKNSKFSIEGFATNFLIFSQYFKAYQLLKMA